MESRHVNESLWVCQNLLDDPACEYFKMKTEPEDKNHLFTLTPGCSDGWSRVLDLHGQKLKLGAHMGKAAATTFQFFVLEPEIHLWL